MSANDKDRFTRAYHRMLERVREGLEKAEQESVPKVRERIDDAMEKAVELGELSREEGEKVAGYLRRDLEDAGRFLAETGQAWKEWLRFDMQYMQDSMWDMFARVADQTSLALKEFRREMRRYDEFRAGEVIGFGTLECNGCGKQLQFQEPATIPVCPECGGNAFVRITSASAGGD